MRRRAGPVTVVALAALVAPAAPVLGQQASVNVIDDRRGLQACASPFGLSPDAADVNKQPQGEAWIDVAEDGRLAATAKDYRFSPTDDTRYNNRVWNGLYLSADAGASWRNLSFEDTTPDGGVLGVTDGAYGRPAGRGLRLTHESDPVVLFDRDGNIYTCGLGYDPVGAGDPSAIVVSRRDRDGRLVTTHLIAPEDDLRLFNDKNWLAVDRESPPERTLVVASWRLFTSGNDALAPQGGWIAVSGDGAATFSAPIRLPVPAAEAAASQFYQPLLARDPTTRRRALYVMLRTGGGDGSIAMHVAKADIEGALGTAALEARLRDPASWSFLASRLGGLAGFGANGYDGSFRFGSFFMPAVDSDSGRLFAVFHAFDAASRRSRALVTRSLDGAVTWSAVGGEDTRRQQRADAVWRLDRGAAFEDLPLRLVPGAGHVEEPLIDDRAAGRSSRSASTCRSCRNRSPMYCPAFRQSADAARARSA